MESGKRSGRRDLPQGFCNTDTNGDNMFRCFVCLSLFNSETKLKLHVFRKHSNSRINASRSVNVMANSDNVHPVVTSASAQAETSDVNPAQRANDELQDSFTCLLCKTQVSNVSAAELHGCNYLRVECDECNVTTCSIRDLSTHVNIHHRSRTKHVCPHCQATYPMLKGLIRHLLYFHYDTNCVPVFSCDNCNHQVRLQDMDFHYHRCIAQSFLSTENQCTHCSMCFETLAELMHHCLIRYICQLCMEKFVETVDLGTHMARQHVRVLNGANSNKLGFECTGCNKEYPGRDMEYIKRHQLFRHVQKVMLYCYREGGAMPNRWMSESEYLLHRRFCIKCHTNWSSGGTGRGVKALPAVCPHCKSPLTSGSEGSNQPSQLCYGCAACKSRHLTATDLTLHLQLCSIFKSDDRFVCHVCRKRFFEVAYLSDHLCEAHPTQGTVMLCKCCKQEFDNLTDLSKHMECHGYISRPYDCGICSMTFTTVTALKDHVSLHKNSHESTPQREITCTKCDAMFMSPNDLSRHYATVHAGKQLISLSELFKSRMENGHVSKSKVRGSVGEDQHVTLHQSGGTVRDTSSSSREAHYVLSSAAVDSLGPVVVLTDVSPPAREQDQHSAPITLVSQVANMRGVDGRAQTIDTPHQEDAPLTHKRPRLTELLSTATTPASCSPTATTAASVGDADGTDEQPTVYIDNFELQERSSVGSADSVPAPLINIDDSRSNLRVPPTHSEPVCDSQLEIVYEGKAPPRCNSTDSRSPSRSSRESPVSAHKVQPTTLRSLLDKPYTTSHPNLPALFTQRICPSPQLVQANVESTHSSPQMVQTNVESTHSSPQMAQTNVESSHFSPQIVQANVESSHSSPQIVLANVESTCCSPQMVQINLESTSSSPQLVQANDSAHFSPQLVQANVQSTCSSPQLVQANVESTCSSAQLVQENVETTHSSPQMVQANVESTHSSPQLVQINMESSRSSPQMLQTNVESTHSSPQLVQANVETTYSSPQMVQTNVESAISSLQMVQTDVEFSQSSPQMVRANVESTRSSPQVVRANVESTCSSPQMVQTNVESHPTLSKALRTNMDFSPSPSKALQRSVEVASPQVLEGSVEISSVPALRQSAVQGLPSVTGDNVWPVLCEWIEFFGGEQLMRDLNVCSRCKLICKSQEYRRLHDTYHATGAAQNQCVTCKTNFISNQEFHQHLLEVHR